PQLQVRERCPRVQLDQVRVLRMRRSFWGRAILCTCEGGFALRSIRAQRAVRMHSTRRGHGRVTTAVSPSTLTQLTFTRSRVTTAVVRSSLTIGRIPHAIPHVHAYALVHPLPRAQ